MAITSSRNTVAERIRKGLNERGTLEVLRRGVEMLGLTKPLSLVQFKPALGINPEIQKIYEANRLRVVRQVKHSLNNPAECFDLVLFLNGVAVATVELKSDFTQSVEDAVDQYRYDRNPTPKGGQTEPLLAFPGGALVHFAVSQSEVMMATKLMGPQTVFLPFNKGDHGGKGNPTNPDGFATSYLWEDVWARDSWLDILGRYMIGARDTKTKALSHYIFPRYHQLDATRKLIADVLATHHNLRSTGKQSLNLNVGETEKLKPLDAVGTGSLQEKERALLNEIIEKVNGLFDGELTDNDQLVYVNGLVMKMVENETLIQQAANNSKEQFANSPDLKNALVNAIMDALDAHTAMSSQALNSERIRDGLKDTLLGPAGLYEALRAKSPPDSFGSSLVR